MGRAIHPQGLADLHKGCGKKYRPSNGTEGEIFFSSWCCECARDKAMREGADVFECDDNEKCEIIALTFALDVDHPAYPKEWTFDADGQPCCTAFIPAGEEVPPPRCTKTVDMFEVGDEQAV